jgi:hypothetical protein
MRKAIGLLVLAIGVSVVASPELTSVDAQDKAKTKVKDDPKAKDKKGSATATVGTIEIYKAKDGFRFRIKDDDGKVIAMPPRARETKDEVVQDLEDIKATLNKVKPTEIKD